MLRKSIKFIIPKALWALALAVAVQYYLVFPGMFANLPSDFETTHPKVTIGWLNEPSDSPKYLYYNSGKEGAELVVFFHGNYETVDQNFSAIAQLTGMTRDVLLVEYPGYGDSSGWPWPGDILENTQRTIEKFRKPEQSLVVWGRSLGGAFAVELATREAPKALILESTFLHPLDVIGGNFVSMLLSPLFFLDLDSESKIRELDSTIPVLLIHGDKDHLFDVEVSHRMNSLMSHMPTKQVIFEGGHNQRSYPLDTITDFLAESPAKN